MHISDLIDGLQDLLDLHGDLPLAVTVQPGYPLAGAVQAVRVTHREGEDPRLYFFAETTEYGPTFHEGDDDNTIDSI